MADRTTKELVKEAIFKGVKSYKDLEYEDKQILVQHLAREIYTKSIKDLTINERAFLDSASVVLKTMFYVEQNPVPRSTLFTDREKRGVGGTLGTLAVNHQNPTWWDGEPEKENEPHITDFINQ